MSQHFDIAKERFLDLLADGVSAEVSATTAIANASDFIRAYERFEHSATKPARLAAAPATDPAESGQTPADSAVEPARSKSSTRSIMNRAEYHATRRLIHELDSRRRLSATPMSDPGYNARYERERNAAAIDHIQSLRAKVRPPADVTEAAREDRLTRMRIALQIKIDMVARRRRAEREVRALRAWPGWDGLTRLQQAILQIDVEFGGKAAADVIGGEPQ